MTNTFLERAMELKEELTANRRWLHQHPELDLETKETTAFVTEKLREMGCNPVPVSPNGVLVTLGLPPARHFCFVLIWTLSRSRKKADFHLRLPPMEKPTAVDTIFTRPCFLARQSF